jgi:hypothetical protein
LNNHRNAKNASDYIVFSGGATLAYITSKTSLSGETSASPAPAPATVTSYSNTGTKKLYWI